MSKATPLDIKQLRRMTKRYVYISPSKWVLMCPASLHAEMASLAAQKDELAFEGISMIPGEIDITSWKAEIKGPKESPYEGGVYRLSIEVDHRYPYVALSRSRLLALTVFPLQSGASGDHFHHSVNHFTSLLHPFISRIF
jgi:hypothetical protein